jgi:hypothetical protein
MDKRPSGSAVSGLLASRVVIRKRYQQLSRNPRLPVNRGFFVETERRPAGGTSKE